MLKVNTLAEHIFEPFGQMIKLPERKADTIGPIHEYWDCLSILPGTSSVNYLVTKQRALCLQEMERHIHTPEMLILLEGTCFLPVAPAGELDAEKVMIFQMEPGDAVILHAGTWHWPPFPQGENSNFIVIYQDGTPQNDLEIISLPVRQDIKTTIG